MSPDETVPPPSGPATTPTLPCEEEFDAPIRAGEAERTVTRALDVLSAALLDVEALAMACARALDATAKASGVPTT